MIIKAKILLILLVNNSPLSITVDYPSINACVNAKTEFSLAFTQAYKHSNTDETIDLQGYEMFKNADVKIVSNICTDVEHGSVF